MLMLGILLSIFTSKEGFCLRKMDKDELIGFCCALMLILFDYTVTFTIIYLIIKYL